MERTTERAPMDAVGDRQTGSVAGDAEERPGGDNPVGVTRSWVRAALLAGSSYLVLGVLLWWNVWSTHPTSVTTCGCGDPALSTWFVAWPAYAIAHGLDPLYSSAMFHPTGVNLVANTGDLALGVLLAPVTWVFGPVASLNVALTVAPVASALAMFVLLARWVTHWVAAWAGGLLYGFSPFVVTNLAEAHLNLGFLVVPPLVVACLDELFLRQRRRPAAVGALLGLLVVVQFFLSTEILVIVVVESVVGLVLLCLYGAARDPALLRLRVRGAVVGLATAGAVSVVVLAYPVWFALAGPAHLSGHLWSAAFVRADTAHLHAYWAPTPPNVNGLFGSALNHLTGGYQGTVLSAQYLGLGALIVVVGGLVVWRRDRVLWFFGALGLCSVALAAGAMTWLWSSIPVFENVLPQRFVAMVYLAAAIMVGRILDHIGVAVDRRREGATARQSGSGPVVVRPRWLGTAAVLAVALVVLGPVAGYLSGTLPVTAVPVIVPAWFKTVGPHLGGRQVLLVFPAPFALESALSWQAHDTMAYDMVGGGGPGDVPARAGPEAAGQQVLSQASFIFSSTRRPLTTDAIASVRQALEGWGVTTVVLPDQPELPSYDQIASVTSTAALITAATGVRPTEQAQAWVWTNVDRTGGSPTVTGTRVVGCTTGLANRGAAAVRAATSCVLAGR